MKGNVTNLAFKDEDDGSEENGLTRFDVQIVENGYILTLEFEDGEEMTEVFHDIKEVFARVREMI